MTRPTVPPLEPPPMRLRWRLRTLLVAVAVAGLALGLAARRQRLLDVAARHYRLQTHGAVRVTGRIGPDGRRGPFYRLTALGLWHWEMGPILSGNLGKFT